MDTRSGDIDAGILPYLMQKLNLTAREMERILNQKSGLVGVTGWTTDRRHFLEAALEGHAKCTLALKIETYRLKKYIGAYLAVIGPLDNYHHRCGQAGMVCAGAHPGGAGMFRHPDRPRKKLCRPFGTGRSAHFRRQLTGKGFCYFYQRRACFRRGRYSHTLREPQRSPTQ